MLFKQRLTGDELLRGVVNVIPSAVVTQAIAAAGADLVMIDREHGAIDRAVLHAMIAATAGTACAPLVRVPGVDEAEVKAALDAGAEGVVFPLVRTADDAARAVSYTRYPPEGTRGWGPFSAHARWGVLLVDHLAQTGAKTVCCVFLETVEAIDAIDEIVRVPGVDLFVVARFDLSTALGVHGRFDAPEFVEAEARLEAAVRGSGAALGGIALTPEQTQAMTARGYRVLFQSIDLLAVEGAVAAQRGWGQTPP